MKGMVLINCVDGRVQDPVYDYLTDTCSRPDYVLTEWNAAGCLASEQQSREKSCLIKRIDFAFSQGGVDTVVLASHDGCCESPSTGSPPENIRKAAGAIRERYPDCTVTGLVVTGGIADEISI